MKKAILSFNFVLMLVLVLTSCKKKTPSEPPIGTEWTIISYCDGNNNLDNYGGSSCVIADVQEMEKVGSTDKVKIVAMVGSFKTGGQCKYYYVEKHADELPDQISSKMLEDLGTVDMSDPTTLSDFISYVKTNYQAKHYMLIIDDHGGGWRGCCSDEQNGAGDFMNLVELKSALNDAGINFDVICFHACLMSMAEVAYQLKDCGKYLVASQFTMPMRSVLGSEEWLGSLTATPGMSASDLAKNIARAVYNSGVAQGNTVHMAATDLSKMATLASCVGNFGQTLLTEAGSYWNEVYDAWCNTHYTQYDDPAFVDLREYVINIQNEPNIGNIPAIANDASALKDAINNAVIYTSTNASGITRGGLCIHFPYNEQLFDSTNYVKLDFTATNWYKFLSTFIASIGVGNTATVSGTVTWPGHTLSSNTVAFLDTSHTQYIYPVGMVSVDTSTGNYTISIDLTDSLEVWVEAWDNLNGDNYIDPGEGFGWWDINQNGQWDDMFFLKPGDNLSGADIILQTVTKQKQLPYHFPKSK